MIDEKTKTIYRALEPEVRAEALAREALKDIKDKMGRPAIGHTAYVAGTGETADERIVGWCHDLVEDTWVTLPLLREINFDEHIVQAVDSVTRREGEKYFDFIDRASLDPLGVRVKIKDNRHNRHRCHELGADAQGMERRYDRAFVVLETASIEFDRIKSQSHGNSR